MIHYSNALKLSAWLAAQHPDAFRVALKTVGKLRQTPPGRLGFFGDASDLSIVTVSADAPVVTPMDTGSPIVDVAAPDLSSITTPSIDTSIADASQSSGGFWSSIGNGVSSVATEIGSLATSLVNPQVLTSVGKVASSYFQAQGQQAQAQVLQTQFGRVYQGAAPAPIGYTRGTAGSYATGGIQPFYYSNAGAQPLNGPLLNRLSYPSGPAAGISSYLPYILGGGVLLTLIAALR